MRGPFLAAIALAALGLAWMARQLRKQFGDTFRHLIRPREARISSAIAIAFASVLLACSGLLLFLIAGSTRYGRFEPGSGVASLPVAIEQTGGRNRILVRDLPASPGFATQFEGRWFAVCARRVTWHGPLAWIGFAPLLRPERVLSADERSDLASPARIRSVSLSDDHLFEALLAGPAGRIGLWTYEELRSPWRPVTAGTSEALFSERGTITVSE